MRTILQCVLLGFFAILIVLKILERRGLATEKRWAAILAGYMTVFVAAATLYYSAEPVGRFPPTAFSCMLTLVLSVLTWLIDYPLAKWIYKEFKNH